MDWEREGAPDRARDRAKVGKKAVKGKQVRRKGGDRYGKKVWRLLKVVCVTYPDSECIHKTYS